jgi:hypothetical protein
MDDVVASNPKANMTYDVINTCVEFKISKPHLWFHYNSELILSKERERKATL